MNRKVKEALGVSKREESDKGKKQRELWDEECVEKKKEIRENLRR